ncbi:MAG: hypothetical protein J6L77_07330 [Coprococcus sp.]|nr:hypothetical protein [Coprococcus sp.]
MSFIFSSLDRKSNEEQVQFDNRISRLLPVLAGRVYFDIRNYDNATGELNVYVEWDDELMDKLHYRLSSGGYYVKATIKQAYEFHELKTGLPVYMKLISREGRIYPYRTYTMAFGRPYSIEFGGGMLIPFEDRYEELGCAAAEKLKAQVQGCSRKISLNGSQRICFNGSQQIGLFGSQSRYLFGSQQGYLFGSQGRYLFGSQRSYLLGSQSRYLFGSQRGYLLGSQSRFIFGSQRGYWLGSQSRFIFGSQSRYLFGSQPHFMIVGSQQVAADEPKYNGVFPMETVTEYWSFMPPEWQIINNARRPVEKKGGNARFGYGLDLI